jgi:protein-S-isoprenylcysteine O-methyltransferase Ste14
MAELKGIEKWIEHIPDYIGLKIFTFPLLMGISFTIGLLNLLFFDLISRTYPENDLLFALEPILPITGVVINLVIGFTIISLMWRKKNQFLQENKVTAYQRGFRIGINGIGLILSVLFHLFFNISVLFSTNPINPLTETLSINLLKNTIILSENGFIVRIILWLVFFILGLLSVRRSLLNFGIDYMGLIYLYYPEESEVQNNKIYSVLRHPAYGSLFLIGLSGVFLIFSIYSFIFYSIFVIGFTLFVANVEEKELVERFGDSYKDYMKRIPRFFPKPNKMLIYLKYVIKG